MSDLNGKIRLKDIVYDITDTYCSVSSRNGEIYLFPDIDAECSDENVEYELCSARLYHNNGFNTHASSLEELKGKKFVWDSEENADGEEAGTLCVLGHENHSSGTIEIIDVSDGFMTIYWSGLANVYWSEEYGSDIPFEAEFTVKLPKIHFPVAAFKATNVKIDSDTRLEILNLDEFNKEVERVSASRKWDDFNTVLKFKLIHLGKDYFGEVAFTNGKNNFVTAFDGSCPRKVAFLGVDFNLRVNYEMFTFDID
ncbi:MAG: hypothetical protein K2G32_01175 [Oscillospiraceae bacterium]|nr:hypothetical protein [Oscillospiraceae bacterium]